MNRSCVAAVVLLLFLTPFRFVSAALVGPYESYVMPSPDGMHQLVMLSSLRGNELNSQYPASGYYELCSDVPLWTVNRFYADCHLSEDGRHLVQCNPRGVPERGLPGSWAVKFYDRGREIRSYDVADLLDYPELMPFISWGWEWRYMGMEHVSDEIRGDSFFVCTSTRERYSFDITTGEIVEEHHSWRSVSTAAKIALFACAIGLALWYFGTKKRRLERVAKRRLNQPPAAATRHSFRFSLRTLLAFTTICAVFAAVFRAAPHVGIFLTSALIPLAVMFFIRPVRVVSTIRRFAARGLIFISWLPFYVLSMGPALAIVEYFLAEWDVRMVVLRVPYYPVTWLIWNVPYLDLDILGWYLNAWDYWG